MSALRAVPTGRVAVRAPLALAAAAALLAAAPLAAQWPTFESKHAPRLADGSVDLEAPAPRTADGRPDFSGLWERVGPGGINPDFDALQSKDGGPPAATFWNLGAGLRGGLPYTPLAALLRDRRGATAVEFAIIAPALLTVMFVIAETALVFIAEQVMDNATLKEMLAKNF